MQFKLLSFTLFLKFGNAEVSQMVRTTSNPGYYLILVLHFILNNKSSVKKSLIIKPKP